MSEQHPLLEAYLNGELDNQGFADFNDWLREDPEHLREWAVTAFMTHELGKTLSEQGDAVAQPAVTDMTSATQRGLMDAELLDLLQRIESNGEDLDPMALAAKRFPPKPHEKLSKKDWAMAGRYVLEHYVTPRRVAYAAAAVVLLAASLLVFFLAGGPEPTETAPVAIDPPETRPIPKLQPVQVVASITDQLNARWRHGDLPVELSVGTTLSPQQRLTLTHGFAQITTQRGATALLQAPCTIELTDSDNAIRLHHGKLVGHCQTAESQGFTVHVPDMDVVDLGTTFGVEADVEHGSSVLVIDGAVRAQPTERSPKAFEPVVLEKSQARRVAPETGALDMIAVSEAPVFYEDAPHPYVAAVLDAGPVAYWRFEEMRNGLVDNEVQPERYPLVAQGSVKLNSEGMLGSSAGFDNVERDDGFYQTTEPFAQMDDNSPFTIEMWLWIDQELSQETGSGSLGGFYDTRSETLDHIVHMEVQPRDAPFDWGPKSIRVHYEDLVIDRQGDSQPHGLFSSKKYDIDRWQHVVVTHQNGELVLYLDGQWVGKLPAIIDACEAPAFVLGRSMRLDRYLRDSKIDEVAVYDRALTQEEITGHWEAAKPTDPVP